MACQWPESASRICISLGLGMIFHEIIAFVVGTIHLGKLYLNFSQASIASFSSIPRHVIDTKFSMVIIRQLQVI